MSDPVNESARTTETTVRDASFESGEPANRGPRISTIAWGSMLVFLGTVLFLERLDLVDTALIFEWWPVALIAVGVFSRGHFLMAAGVWLLIGKQEPFGLTYSTSWPVILVIIGAGIVFDEMRGDGSRRCAPSQREDRR